MNSGFPCPRFFVCSLLRHTAPHLYLPAACCLLRSRTGSPSHGQKGRLRGQATGARIRDERRISGSFGHRRCFADSHYINHFRNPNKQRLNNQELASQQCVSPSDSVTRTIDLLGKRVLEPISIHP